jgi:predicted nucleotidyltransferase
MKVAGIVAEYNPFHSGHKYHIEETKKITGADYTIAAMSGDFVQRGEPAFFSKYLRTRMALTCGADLVLEIPSVFATGSAEDFASCAIALLNGTGVVDVLSFGSEDGDLSSIRQAAAFLAEESPALSEGIRQGLKQGLSWPQARNQALLSLHLFEEDRLNRVLGSPNSLLGIEYCKALIRQHSSIEPFTVVRRGHGYHAPELSGGQASASALRKALKAGDDAALSSLLFHIPGEIAPMYREEHFLEASDCSSLLNYRLLSLLREGADFSDYADVSEDLASRLKNCVLQFTSWEGRINQLKTRQYTYTRISRALTHLLLGVTKELAADGKAAGYTPYIRILGFQRNAAPLLSELKKKARLPLITKTADAENVLDGTALAMFTQDLYSSHLRQSLEREQSGVCPKNEFNREICIL